MELSTIGCVKTESPPSDLSCKGFDLSWHARLWSDLCWLGEAVIHSNLYPASSSVSYSSWKVRGRFQTKLENRRSLPLPTFPLYLPSTVLLPKLWPPSPTSTPLNIQGLRPLLFTPLSHHPSALQLPKALPLLAVMVKRGQWLSDLDCKYLMRTLCVGLHSAGKDRDKWLWSLVTNGFDTD